MQTRLDNDQQLKVFLLTILILLHSDNIKMADCSAYETDQPQQSSSPVYEHVCIHTH